MSSSRQTCTWRSIDPHDIYVRAGRQLDRRQLISKLVRYFGDEIVVLSIEGCASVIGFCDEVGKVIKLSKVMA